MKILILEDEIPAYQKLLSYIKTEIADCEVLGWARSVKEAKEFLNGDLQPDLIFADVELLDGISFEVFEQVKINCPIVFCTAFDRYVLRAFRTNGIAYLLKPYSMESFQEAYQKYQTLFIEGKANIIHQEVLEELKKALYIHPKNYKTRFAIKKKEGVKLLEVKNICCIEASGDFCRAVDSKSMKHVVTYSMTEIESMLDPTIFFRISRSHIINIDFIDKIVPNSKNRLSIKLSGLDELLITSSNKTPEFRKWIEE